MSIRQSGLSLKMDHPIPMAHGQFHLEMRLFPKKILGLVGPNGIGKSTLFHFFKMNQDALFPELRVGFLDQWPLTPLPHLRGIDLFEMLDEEFPERKIHSHLFNFPLLQKFAWRERLMRPISQLSGGENQVLKILALFYLKTDVFVLDEPANHLDYGRKRVLLDYLKEIKGNDYPPFYMIMCDHNRQFLWESCCEFHPIRFLGPRHLGTDGPVPLEEVSLSLWETWTNEYGGIVE